MTPLEAVFTRAFEASLKALNRRYPGVETAVRDAVANVTSRPESGDVYPGFAPSVVRKTRIGLPSHGMGARRGLRMIHVARPDKGRVGFLVLYKKGDFRSEHEVKACIVKALKEHLGLDR